MARKDKGTQADRRRFLTGVVAAGAATAATAITPTAAREAERIAQNASKAPPPSRRAMEAET